MTGEPTARRSRGRGLVVLAVVLALVGVSLIGWALTQQRTPPVAPAAVDAGIVGPAAPTASTPAPGSGAPRAASPPTTIAIPSIGVSSPVDSVGLAPDGALEVPAPGPRYDHAAWFRLSVTPGEVGPSVILGHVDSAANGPSVFYRLGEMAPTQIFTVGRADGSTLRFEVDGVRSYPKDAFPTDVVYGGTRRPEIRLITCGGPFDSAEHSYRDNTVVFGHLLPDDAPGSVDRP